MLYSRLQPPNGRNTVCVAWSFIPECAKLDGYGHENYVRWLPPTHGLLYFNPTLDHGVCAL